MTFQELVLALEGYWAKYGCAILQPYDVELGAGTMNPATFLRVLGPEPWNVAYVEPSRRPADGRYGENPNRLQHYYQYQVILKPSPLEIQDIYIESLAAFGINPLGPSTFPILPTEPIISGVAMITSTSAQPPWIFSIYSSPPTRSAPASSASLALSPFVKTKTFTDLPVPCGRTVVPRII